MYINDYGYMILDLQVNGKTIRIREHKLNALINNSLKDVYNRDNDVHHKNFCKIDNSVKNLEVMSKSEHHRLHNTTREVSLKTRENMSKNHADFTGDKHPRFNPCIPIRKYKNKNCKQGFIWVTQPSTKNGLITLSSVNLDTCKEKVEEFINSEKNTYGYTYYEVKE